MITKLLSRPLRLAALAASSLAGLLLAAGALAWLPAGRAAAAPALDYTYPSVACPTTLQACIDAASGGTTIHILAGTYTESLSLWHSVSLVGAGPYATILKAPANQRVLTISGPVGSGTVISGLMVTGGHNTTQDFGDGGGIYVFVPAEPLLVGLVISNNYADSNGGGLYSAMPVQVANTLFYSNSSYYDGGGLYAWDYATITDSVFTLNKSPYNGGGAAVEGNGGDPGGVSLLNTSFTGNESYVGGGLFSQFTTTVSGGSFTNNLAGDDGGGLLAPSLTATGTVFTGNQAADEGGGAKAGHNWLTNVRFEANQSQNGGGGLFAKPQFFNDTNFLTGTLFISNTAVNGSGGGLDIEQGNGIISGGRFERNQAGGIWYGGGFYVNNVLTMTGAVVVSNTAHLGGGGLLHYGGVLTDVRFAGNTATESGGGLAGDFDAVVLDACLMTGNSAPLGGGVYVYYGSLRITNSLLADNQASQAGAGLLIPRGSATLLHTTVAAASLNPGQAVVVGQGGPYTGTLAITDTIIANYAIGISQTESLAFENFNLFFGNTTDSAAGVTHGGSSLTGQSPAFANPAGGDYHIGPGSAAINQGTNAGIAVDIDSDARPLGGGFDIGFDEYVALALNNKIYLPALQR